MTNVCPYCGSSDAQSRGYSGEGELRKRRMQCNNCAHYFRVSAEEAVIEEFKKSKKEIDKLLDHRRYIVTSALSNTPIDQKFWKSLLKLAEHYKAQLLVIPVYLYRKDPWWPPEITPYLLQDEIKPARGVRIFGDTPISGTAVNPLSGLDTISQGDSAIVGHAQIQMRTVPTPQNRLPKIMMTTGSVSVKNYPNTGPGKKADFHHSLGAAIIEIDGDDVHIRSVVGDKKSEFYDVDLHCTPRGVTKIDQIEGFWPGDEHALFSDPVNYIATYSHKHSIVNTLKPKFIGRNDVLDSYSISHHHKDSPSIKYKKHVNGTDRLEDELKITARYLEQTTPKGTLNIMVSSNHHDHVRQWLESIDWRDEPQNAILYHELWLAWLKAINADEEFDPFVYWMQKNCRAPTTYLTPDEPHMIKNIYVGYHGHKGSNGGPGSITGYAKIGVKTIIGHRHSPGIEKGCYQIGTSSYLSLEYTEGPSSWMHTHCLIFPNGKRQLINVHPSGKWRKPVELKEAA